MKAVVFLPGQDKPAFKGELEKALSWVRVRVGPKANFSSSRDRAGNTVYRIGGCTVIVKP